MDQKSSPRIKINGSNLTPRGERTRLEFFLEVGEKKSVLWFETDKKWGQYFCDGIADGVVVTLLLYAIRGGYDIESALPVSKSLLNQLNNHVIPQLALCAKEGYLTRLICPIATEEYHPTAVATAMSMGVDSFTTFFEYTKDCPPESERINLLTFLESGQTGFVEDEDGMFAEQLADARRFAEENHFDLLDMSSNVCSCYIDLFWDEWMIHVSTYRNCGMILLLQKLIKVYYYSSSYNLDIFHCSLNEDVTHYEKWLIPNISTANTTIYNSNKAMTRIEKTAYLCKNPETYEYLQVCVFDRHSCGKCNKCLRTEFTLEYLGALDHYRNVFDVDTFRKNRKHNLTELLMENDNSLDAEVLDLYQDEITGWMRLSTKIVRFRRYNPFAFAFVNGLYKVFPFSKALKRLFK